MQIVLLLCGVVWFWFVSNVRFLSDKMIFVSDIEMVL